MKKNAVLIAGIMFVAGCASSDGQRASYDSTWDSPSRYDRADVSLNSTEQVRRDASQAAVPPSDVDTSMVVTRDPVSSGSYGSSVSGSGKNYETHSYTDSDIKADSSIRGGSLEARGYDQEANNDEIEGEPDPINPGKQADSSIRGGSIYARERNWNQDSEPSSGSYDSDRHMKADSSIRGGSIEARGGREAQRRLESRNESRDSSVDIRSSYESEGRDDFGQGSSATWKSDKGQGSVRGSASWNASDDLMRDGLSVPSDDTTAYEINNDASIGGAASSEVGTDSSEPAEDLNSSEQLEKNISGEYDLDEQESKVQSSRTTPDFQSSTELDASGDSNSTDTFDSSNSSLRSTDTHHDESDLRAAAEIESGEMNNEAAGAAASSEVGSSSSNSIESNSDDSFESNDPAMKKTGSPLGTAANEPNFLYEDNRALGVGSLATGEFGSAPVNQSGRAAMTDEQLSQQVKGLLSRESAKGYGLTRQQVARNIEVSVDNGEVTLTGTVPSETDKSIVEVQAREISGVKEVHNELTVTPEADSDHRDLSRGSDLEDTTSQLQD